MRKRMSIYVSRKGKIQDKGFFFKNKIKEKENNTVAF
jgi:hypothetical protein